jgi:hypothetical protein
LRIPVSPHGAVLLHTRSALGKTRFRTPGTNPPQWIRRTLTQAQPPGPIHEAAKPGAGIPIRNRDVLAARVETSRGRAVPAPFVNWPGAIASWPGSSEIRGKKCGIIANSRAADYGSPARLWPGVARGAGAGVPAPVIAAVPTQAERYDCDAYK